MIERSISKLVVPKKKERFIENEFVEIWSENGIILQKIKPGVVMDITAGQQIVKDRMFVSDQITMPTLIDLRHLIHIDIETRTFFASEAGQRYLSAGAFLIGYSGDTDPSTGDTAPPKRFGFLKNLDD